VLIAPVKALGAMLVVVVERVRCRWKGDHARYFLAGPGCSRGRDSFIDVDNATPSRRTSATLASISLSRPTNVPERNFVVSRE
jgi:hypothetical protein